LNRLKKIIFILLTVFLAGTASAQFPQISIATDVGLQRNFKKEQKYWAIGQTISAIFHVTRKDAVYIWFAYYSNGKFKNNLTADAKSFVTLPQQINYTNRASMQVKHFSIGYRKYLKGGADAENRWNLYAYGGLGVMGGKIENTHSITIDTSIYNLPVLSGSGSFKRLTLDLGAGWELPLSGGFSLYAEARTWIPTTDYPSKYIFVNDNAPLVGMFNVGLRLLFD